MQVSDKVQWANLFNPMFIKYLEWGEKSDGSNLVRSSETCDSVDMDQSLKDLESDLLMMTAVICNKVVYCSFVKIP